MYFNYYYAEQFTKYPPDVAKSLRRALYYSNHGLDVNLAHKYYRLALEQCREHRMDPFSDDVVGIKIQLSHWLEQMNNIPDAAKVLDMVLTENKKWLAMVEKNPEKLPMAPVPGTVIGEGENARTITKEEFDLWVRSARTRVLAKSCQISVKLGTLCAHDQILNNDKSHEHFIWATENALKEFHRRAVEGVKEGEGSWLGPKEIGGTLECEYQGIWHRTSCLQANKLVALGQSFERREQFDLALPLFFQALRLCDDQCHLAVISKSDLHHVLDS
jgi:tetratricopeptide (TPR) repeat protein